MRRWKDVSNGQNTISSFQRDYLKYKLEAKGISIEKVDESHTTQTCPVCGKKQKTSSRNFVCPCGYSRHRDVHSACNILTKYLYGTFQPIPIHDHKYLRIAWWFMGEVVDGEFPPFMLWHDVACYFFLWCFRACHEIHKTMYRETPGKKKARNSHFHAFRRKWERFI